MIVVGIHNTGVCSSAAIVVDGSLEFACCEERLDRRKYSKYFPQLAIQACLDWVGCSLDDIGCFAVGWNPAINIGSRLRPGYSEWPGYAGARLYSNPNHLLPRLSLGELEATEQVFSSLKGAKAHITYVTHHLAHCANAYFLSGFEDAAVFSCDGYGERATTVWGTAEGGDISIHRQIKFPHSIGVLYSAITEFLGFRADLDEWKVMGAAAYGDASRYAPAIRKLLCVQDDGQFELELKYFNHFDFDTKGLCSPHLIGLLGEPRQREESMSQRHYDIAAAVQEVTEDYLMTALRWLRQQSGKADLCLTGGVLMNSVFNGKAANSGVFRRVFVPYAPDDSGNAIGAALYVAQRSGDRPRQGEGWATPYLGRQYSDAEIADVIARYRLKARREEDIVRTAAALIASGKVLGWFQGRMEFGQRALGGRSILADPRRGEMKDRINAAVKYRETFRPFAPSVLARAVGDYFECGPDASAPYMEKVFAVRPDKRAIIPAVVHADGTGRLQTVERAHNPLYHDLILRFESETGVPVLLNTSYNLNNEPIVESPTDAIRTFYSSGLDALALGSYVLLKEWVA